MNMHRNPFTALYVTERMEQSKFAELFSPIMVPHVLPLFEAGNVVVEGTQGTGKSMLLALLQTDIRLAFEKHGEDAYPRVEDDQCQFVSAGINLATNQALRSVSRWSNSNDNSLIESCFTDYVNTWILRDLLSSIRMLMEHPRVWGKYQLGGTPSKLAAAIHAMGASRELKGFIPAGANFSKANIGLTERIESYLGFFNGRPKSLPDPVLNTQSYTLGQPLIDAVKILRGSGCLNSATRVLITVDQFEQLLEIENSLPGRPYKLLRNSIDQAIHRREPTLSIRVGTRPYAWRQKVSEVLRDYTPLNLDDMLARKEHGRNVLFPLFAADVFVRRLRCFKHDRLAAKIDPLKAAFGKSPSPEERIRRCGPNANWAELVQIPKEWPPRLRKALSILANSDPLTAKLGIAWYHQQFNRVKSGETESVGTLDFGGELPWSSPGKIWWRKERRELAVLQLATANRQRVPRYGKKDIIELSGANILVFASICQHIWDCYLRDITNRPDILNDAFPIDWMLQDEGVRSASDTWHEKIADEPWVGNSLQAFIDEVARYLGDKLRRDVAMSYPGGNGFSLSNRELLSTPQVEWILSEGTGRGFLIQRRHTSKTRARGESTKWYLHPVLSPYYELTLTHTKEPVYIRTKRVLEWLEKSGYVLSSGDSANGTPLDLQKRLPFEKEGDV